MTTQDLTLPGTIPNLLHRTSPVVLDFDGKLVLGVIVGTDDRPENQRVGPWLVATVEDWPDFPLEVEDMTRSCSEAELSLDLTHETGRAHARKWLARRFNLPTEQGTRWRQHRREYIEDPRWVIEGSNANSSQDFGWPKFGNLLVPSLAGLDPDDPRTLTDGSKWVDVEALHRVCLQVASLETP